MTHNGIGCLVLIGSNQRWSEYTPKHILKKVITTFYQQNLYVRSVSRFFETPAFPAGSGPNFANAALEIRVNGDADSVLETFHQIEHDMGRLRDARWAPRTVDIDLISYGSQILPDAQTQRAWMDLPLDQQMALAPDRLIVPHPRMHERAFVLGPLMDIAPDWVHPVIGLSVRQMYDALPEQAKAELQIL